MLSRLTGGPTSPLFTASVLGKHRVQYYRCEQTGFIQTEDPYWLDEAYSSAITALDLGLLSRCISLRNMTSLLLKQNFGSQDRFIDYGGGYGTFTRLMRDWGYEFQHHDPMCQNLFAAGFEWKAENAKQGDRPFALLTAWEVFEHLVDPMEETAKMLDLSDTVLFSTMLVPTPHPTSVDDWWYFIPETGQHVSLYTLKGLRSIAKTFDCQLYSDGNAFHAFSRRKLRWTAFNRGFTFRVRRGIGKIRSSLTVDAGPLRRDLEKIRKDLNKRLGSSN